MIIIAKKKKKERKGEKEKKKKRRRVSLTRSEFNAELRLFAGANSSNYPAV